MTRKSTHEELEQRAEELEKEVVKYKRAEEALRESEERYRLLFEQSPIGIGLAFPYGKVVSCNKAMEAITGYSIKELKEINLADTYENPRDRKLLVEAINRYGGVVNFPVRLKRKDGTPYDTFLTISRVHCPRGEGLFQTICTDVTKQKQTEKALWEKDEQLKHQAQHLEKVKTALNVLLEHRQEEKKKLEASILTNVKKLVFPYTEKMDKGSLDEKNQAYLSAIKSNLKNLISPFANTLSSKYFGLTPTEIQIADLIKLGKESKEIASLLNVSCNAISFHRGNIRKKLGLLNKKINLRSYLQSISH